MGISDTKLRGLHGKPYKGPTEITDADGLGVRITPKGIVSFQYRYRMNGSQHRLGIGRYPLVSLRDARIKVGEYKELIAQGIDPKHQQTVKIKKPTVHECIKYWYDNYVLQSLRKSTAEVYERIVLNEMEKYFLGVPIEHIPVSTWVDFFTEQERANPLKARKLLVHLRGAVAWCERRHFIDSSSLLRLNPKEFGRAPKTGDTVLTYRQLAKIWLENESSNATYSSKLLIKGLILYGSRNSELRESTKEEFDFEEGIWTLPSIRSKTDKIIRRPIFKQIQPLLKEAIDSGDGLLFHGAFEKGTPFSIGSSTRYVRFLRDKLNFGNFTAHDFRRTMATRLAEEGIAPHVIEKMLGHDLGGVLTVYNKHDWLAEQRVAYELYADKIFEQIKIISD
ncbi:site-specific integrase [Pantoea sp. Mb-10]|uniref:tyrosine-type recombinase/integrase n=1 Tax=unclassified Pantoea TaxID=2630326 RepID=UPI001E5FB1E8|nr:MULTISPECIES: site-specific integrase [unclassified Pantoea]MCE0490955.1 site-specific integrase [Pantoea sp. Mb-10]MCE0499887.1 site-specific integrase [Pantoea sp. Pb-8]